MFKSPKLNDNWCFQCGTKSFYLKNQTTFFWIFRRISKSEIIMCITAFKITL